MESADRRRAVVVAGHTGDTETIVSALTDPDPSVRAAAVGAAVRAGAAHSTVVHAAMADPDAEVRRRGVLACTAVPDAAPALIERLADPASVVAETAAFVLGELPTAPAGAVDSLVEAARTHPEHIVREAAVAALGAIGDPAGLPAVLGAMAERATIRRRAVLALAAFDDPRADVAIRDALTDRDRQVRQAAEDLLDEPG